MADLKSRVEDALNEARILILGGQVLIGAAFRLFFMRDFEQTPLWLRAELAIVLGLMLIALGMLFLPAAFHQIAARGEDTAELHAQATNIMDATLSVFAVGFASFASVAAFPVIGPAHSTLLGVVALLLALGLWYALPLAKKHHPRGATLQKLKAEEHSHSQGGGSMTSLDEKIKTVLIETRMVLPGAQALLGFQLISMFEKGFDRISFPDKIVHVASLLAVGVATVLLMAPAAFHRIAEAGENTERVHHYAAHMLLAAMFMLGLGMAGDFQVILHMMTRSHRLSIPLAAALLLFFYTLWFGYSFAKRTSTRPTAS